MVRSKFLEDLEALKKKICATCSGLGQCNDASPYDMVYNKWACPSCKGTGYDGKVPFALTWLPIDQLHDKHQQPLMLASPELICLDTNPFGISEGFWQDDVGWRCVGYDMNNDEFNTINLAYEDVTHFLIPQGPFDICMDKTDINYGMPKKITND